MNDWDTPKAVTYREKLQRLCNAKIILEKREAVIPGDYANEWLELSRQFAEINAKANTHYCLMHAYHYAEPSLDAPIAQPAPEFEQEESEVYDWQNEENNGGG